MIGPRTAAVLYAALIAVALATLHGKARTFALIIILALAVKSYIDYLRRRME